MGGILVQVAAGLWVGCGGEFLYCFLVCCWVLRQQGFLVGLNGMPGALVGETVMVLLLVWVGCCLKTV